MGRSATSRGASLRADDHWLMLLTMAFLAALLLHALVPMLPELHWDIDPRSARAAGPITMFGPAGVAWLSVLGLVLATASMLLHHGAGGRIAWRSTVIGILFVAVALLHMGWDYEAVHRGGVWIGAVGYALAALHLGQHERPRRYLLAGLVVLIIPLTVRTLIYVAIEHPQTVSMYLDQEAQFLQERGWAEGSPQHLLYRRRLMFPDATGSFGLSNVFGSIMAALTVLATGLTLGLWRRRAWQWSAAPALLVLGGLATVWLSHSKGALGALAAGWLMLAAIGVLRRRKAATWALPALALLLTAGAVAAVLLRPMLLGAPTGPDSELSLLFRWHYWQGAARILAGFSAAQWFAGVGPGVFKPFYMLVKNPLNPEEVTSTHNVVLDYTVMLGIAGMAWSVMLLAWLGRAGRQAGADAFADEPGAETPGVPEPVDRDDTLRALAITGAAMVIQMMVQLPAMLTPESFLGWGLAIIGMLTVMAALVSPGWMDRLTISGSLLAAAMVLLVHNQIEMTFYHDGAAALATVMIALAAATPMRGETQPPRRMLLAPAVLGVITLAALFRYAVPVTRYDQQLQTAARHLREGDPLGATAGLRRAGGILPTDPDLVRWMVTLTMEEASFWISRGDMVKAQQRLGDALQMIQQRRRDRDVPLYRLEAQLQQYAADSLDQPARREAALAAWRKVLTLNPYGLQDHLSAADLLWTMGRRDEAAAMYRRCLELSDAAFLDPAKQLAETDRKRAEQRQ